MNVMRHLRVPNKSVQDVIVLLRDIDMLNNDMMICPDSDGKHRLIPLSESAPHNLPSDFSEFEEVIHEGKLIKGQMIVGGNTSQKLSGRTPSDSMERVGPPITSLSEI